jgi:hypothetical protein
VAEEVLEQAQKPSDKAEEEEMETFRRLMGTVSDDVAFGPDFGSDRRAGADGEAPEPREDR